MKKSTILLLFLILVMTSCQTAQDDSFYQNFQNPPAEARPFVRWWWNGNHIEESELLRQLDVLKAAGMGGVEINPIAMPEEAKDIGTEPVVWLSGEWNRLLALTAQETQKRGMIADMIVGSGWPFGGEFLAPDEYIQKVLVNKIPVTGETIISEDMSSLLNKLEKAYQDDRPWFNLGETHETDLHFLSLVPLNATSANDIISLWDKQGPFEEINYTVPEGNYLLVYGVKQIGHRMVMHGAPGADGHVMDHYDQKVTMDYLNRLQKITEDTGIPLSELIRALFCDSIELGGANWTDDFADIFQSHYGYDLNPYFPFIFYHDYDGYVEEGYTDEIMQTIQRVRYDYNQLLVEVFLDNFTRTFQEFCTENDLLCRYQAYGTPFLMGMMEGYMIPDIPESNNWIYSAEMDDPLWKWSKGHGYMIWNHYAASGGHLTGRKIISCEAMTNTRGVFKASLEEIKQHDDMNFISGINHSILHGYNYSPPEAGFPGWIRYGEYFSEQNTWWPYLKNWTDYNARLSYVFQNSAPQKSIAILPPTGDLWGTRGLTRTPFHYNPWYVYDLWETLSQSGSSCDYVNEKVVQGSKVSDGKLNYGPMFYDALMLCDVKSVHPETAQSIQQYVTDGGKLILVGEIPSKSLSYMNAEENDRIIGNLFAQLIADFPEQVFVLEAPVQDASVLKWTIDLLEDTEIKRQIEISIADEGLYQIHKTKDDLDIYFFTNTWRDKTLDFQAAFPTETKTPWIWNPHTGEKTVFPYSKDTPELNISLQPLESLLLVFEPGVEEPSEPPAKVNPESSTRISTTWKATLEHINGTVHQYSWDVLPEFSTSGESVLQNFAGTVTYETTFTSMEGYTVLDLGEVNEGITEVFLNGAKVGEQWYGLHRYDLENHLKDGENKLKVVYTTLITNYVMSLEGNPTAERWTRGFEPVAVGLTGDVELFQKVPEK